MWPVVLGYMVQMSFLRDELKILDKADSFSHGTNTLWKGMNPIIPPPAMGK